MPAKVFHSPLPYLPTYDPVQWGPIYWRFMHIATLLHGRAWSREIVACLSAVDRCIPDTTCKETAREFLASNPLPSSDSEYVSEMFARGPFEWVNRFHNFVSAAKKSTALSTSEHLPISTSMIDRNVTKTPNTGISLISSEVQTIDWLRLSDDPLYQQTPAYTPDSPVSIGLITRENHTLST
jgi:hypothetical protein